MNDLKKDELECLENAIDLQLKKIPMSSENIRRREMLVEKLRFLINHYDTKVIQVWHCEKCGHVQ